MRMLVSSLLACELGDRILKSPAVPFGMVDQAPSRSAQSWRVVRLMARAASKSSNHQSGRCSPASARSVECDAARWCYCRDKPRLLSLGGPLLLSRASWMAGYPDLHHNHNRGDWLEGREACGLLKGPLRSLADVFVGCVTTRRCALLWKESQVLAFYEVRSR